MKTRYKCTAHFPAIVEGRPDTVPVYFKRYGEDPETVKKELIDFIKEAYDATVEVDVDVDKTHPAEEVKKVKKEKETENDTGREEGV